MRRTITIILVIGLLEILFSGCGIEKEKDKKSIGRFHLVPATIDTSVKGREHEIKFLFKIDTETGNTWVYWVFVSEAGKAVNEWVLIQGGTADDPLGIRQSKEK